MKPESSSGCWWVCSAVILLLASVVTASRAGAQTHFTPPHNTGVNATLVVQTSIHPTINGDSLSTGDEIGVYTPGAVLGGAGVWTGANIAISLWGDDQLTAAVVEGFAAGDSLVFRLWDAGTGSELPAAPTWTGSAPVWVANALITNLAGLTAGAADTSRHFQPPSGTGSNATLLVQASVNPTIDGVLLATGDEIGIYTPRGDLAGAAAWTGVNIAITLWGDDAMTPALDGFLAGETLSFRIWDRSAGVELAAQAGWTGTTPVWSANGIIQTLVSLVALTSQAPVLPPSHFVVSDAPDDAGGAIRLRFQVSPHHPGASGDLDAEDPISHYTLYINTTRDSASAITHAVLMVGSMTTDAQDMVTVIHSVTTGSALRYYWISAGTLFTGDPQHPGRESPRVGPNAGAAMNNVRAAQGDLDGNAEVDIFDVAMIASVFGNAEEYDQVLDLSGNGEVDIFDVAAIAQVFGKTVP